MAKIIWLILFGLFAFLTATVAAFVYLEWWQAILASFFTFLLLVYAGKLMIRAAFRRLTKFATDMMKTKSRVLHNATADVHAVKPTTQPESAIPSPDDEDEEDDEEPVTPPAELNWYEIDVSIFPNPKHPGPMFHWDIDDLALVSIDAVVPDTFDDDEEEEIEEFPLFDMRVVVDGEPTATNQSKFQGPHRLRFIAGVAKAVREVKFRYYFETFGRIPLPNPMLLPPAPRVEPI